MKGSLGRMKEKILQQALRKRATICVAIHLVFHTNQS